MASVPSSVSPEVLTLRRVNLGLKSSPATQHGHDSGQVTPPVRASASWPDTQADVTSSRGSVRTCHPLGLALSERQTEGEQGAEPESRRWASSPQKPGRRRGWPWRPPCQVSEAKHRTSSARSPFLWHPTKSSSEKQRVETAEVRRCWSEATELLRRGRGAGGGPPAVRSPPVGVALTQGWPRCPVPAVCVEGTAVRTAQRGRPGSRLRA